jgi:hypothetical protein
MIAIFSIYFQDIYVHVPKWLDIYMFVCQNGCRTILVAFVYSKNNGNLVDDLYIKI